MKYFKAILKSPLSLKAAAFYQNNRSAIAAAAILIGVATTAGAFMLFGPPRMIELTETPEFCALCHASQNKDWLHSTHRKEKCIDCHLPNNNFANHYIWKSIDGGKDVFFHFSGLGDGNDTDLTGHGKAVLQGNCIRCHTDMVSHIGNKRNCMDCHRSFSHRRTALTLTQEETRK